MSAVKKILQSAAVAGLALFSLAATAGEAPQQPDSERQRQLRQILAQDCSVCHGPALQGDLGPALTAKSLAGKSEDALVLTIREGHDETAMPPWWWMIEEHEARWLVRLIRNAGN